MTRTHRTLVLAGALLLASTAMLGFRAGQTRASPTSVAVVDLFKLMNQLDEFKEDDAELEAMALGFEKEINDAIEQLKAKQSEIRDLVLTPEEDFNKRANLLEMNAAVEAARQRSGLILQFNENIKMIDLYKKVSEATREIAAEKGYDLVLIRSDESSFGALRDDVQPQQLRELMVLRQTIFVADSIDITDQLATRMNNLRKLDP